MSFLVIDCGTSGCRAATVSETGAILSQSREEVTITHPAPGFAEVDCDHLWRRVVRVVRAEVERHPPGTFQALGVSCILGYVLLDKDRLPLAPSVIWMDNRAVREIDDILRVFPQRELYRRTGRRISPELLAPKLLWYRKHLPELFCRTEKIIGLKDELVRRMTGVPGTDFAHLDYSLLFNIHTRLPDPDILKGLDIDGSLFPHPRPATDLAGRLSPSPASAFGLQSGIPVVTGSIDGTTAMYGGGVLIDGSAVLVSGTTDVLMVSSPQPVDDSTETLSVNTGMVPGVYLTGGAMGLGGGALAYLEKLFQTPASSLEEAVSRLPPGCGGLLVFPGLTGERSPYWKSFMTGGIVGLTLDHTPAHIFRAAMEGSSFRTARLLKALKDNRVEPVIIHLVGGYTGSGTWNQIRADITGLDVARLSTWEATALGTAMFCRAGLDPSRSLHDITREWIRIEKRYRPNPASIAVYRDLSQAFETFIESNDRIYRMLHNIKTER